MRQRLLRSGFQREVIQNAIAKLKEENLIDDLIFARFWRDDRLFFRPKSKILIMRELRAKKVALDIIEEVLEGIDDERNAYEAGCRRKHALVHLDYPEFERRLSGYLSYRGFSREVIKRTIELLWQEKCQS